MSADKRGLLMAVVIATAAVGCCSMAGHHEPCAFVKADVRRVGVRPEYATTVMLMGERLEELLRSLPGVGRGKSTSWGEASMTGYIIDLHRANGRQVRVSVSWGMMTWSEGKGSHWLDEGFAKFIAEVMPLPATAPMAATVGG